MNAPVMFPSGNGQKHTHAITLKDGRKNPFYKAGQPYTPITLDRVSAMVADPSSLDKEQALWFIPSTYCEYDARCHDVQRERGMFHCLPVDIDDNNLSLADVQAAVRAVIGDASALYYSTRSAKADDRKWRVLITLAAPVIGADYKDTQDALFDLLEQESGGVLIPDRALNRAAQLVYLPNRSNSGFYEFALPDASAPLLELTPDCAIMVKRKTNAEARRQAHQEAKAAAERRAAKRKAEGAGGDGSVIERYNAAHCIADLLVRYGYERDGRTNDWRSPFQTTGSYATEDYGDYWVSLSGSDASAGVGAQTRNGNRYGDAFDLFVQYEHGGDFTAGVRAYAAEINPPSIDGTAGGGERIDPETGEILDGNSDTAADEAAPVDLWANHGAPELPQGLLPVPIDTFARSHSAMMGVDPAGLAMACLAVCAATITDEIQLQVKQHDPTWRESARLWVGLVGSPSMKKTPIISAAARPLKRIDGNLMRAYVEKRQAYDELTPKERKGVDRPRQERRIISDATIEAAQEVLKDSPRGVLSLQDELSGWFGQMDKYAPGKGAQADRGFWLQAYNGGSYSLNRIGRGASYIPNCSIGLLGGIQPEPIRAIAGDTHDDGLVQRLIPVVLRPGKIGRDAPDDGTLAAYERLIERLELLRAGDAPLRLDEAARAIRERLEAEHLNLAQSLETVSPKMAAHFGKHDGLFARLCVLWHCIEHNHGGRVPETISGNTADRVAQFMVRFIRPSAVAFYAGLLGMSAGHDRLLDLAAWILAANVEEVKARDVQASGQAFRHVTADEVRLLCEKLEAFGWGKWADPAMKSNKPRFLVNPRVHFLFAERGRAEAERRAKARELIRQTIGG